MIIGKHPSLAAYKPVPLSFDEENHAYTLDGKWIPSVTTITGMLDKPWLAAWKVKMCVEYIKSNLKNMDNLSDVLLAAKHESDKQRKAAADTGKAVHKWIELHTQGNDTPPPQDDGRIDQFMSWESIHKPIYIMSEEMVASQAHEYAGTLDLLAEIEGKVLIVDIKTGNSIPSEVSLQLVGGYRPALEECGVKSDGCSVLHLPANKPMEWRQINVPADLCKRAFLGLRETQKWASYLKSHKEDN